MVSLHETCPQYVARRLSEGWKVVKHKGFNVILQSPEGIIRPVDLRNDIETLRPNAAGDKCYCTYAECTKCPNHYQCVDEVVHDGDTTRVGVSGDNSCRELYNLPSHGVGSGIINHITVYAVCSKGGTYLAWVRLLIKSGTGGGAPDTEDYSVDTRLTLNYYRSYSNQWAENPATGSAWTWDEIDQLQAGFILQSQTQTRGFCTQSYVEVDYTAIPDPPTNVQATDGVHTDKVVVTWTKSTGATKYQVFRNGVGLGELGNVATYDDIEAGAPSITPGSADASDGLHVAHVALSLSGQSVANGTVHTYKVKAGNVAGWSGDSGTNTGYRGHGALTYQWQRSSGDSDADYGNISGATTASYNDTGAPANGDGRYYRCVENATGAAQQISSVDRGYRIGIWVGKIAGVTNPASIAGVAAANIAKVKGVASA